ncbi:DUF6597 domain-containing transcriptional factor [Winogradskyella flava]|uniref:Helix-turn-helix domain-containing protein n=1 Tax=Winogradskyella flava TaxID=1884876 RepID=A0A842IS56_9FLAO|nr:DUF6597 domain-containing transcriptional factor [Winogradskyella flava]MBC2846012.1 helix-turn-helix domain-containing protein [Winogradskyella flava]
MKYFEYIPSLNLQNFILNFWMFEIEVNEEWQEPILHETIPDSSISIVLINKPQYKGVRILGPHSQKFQQAVFKGSIFLGIRLHPWIYFEMPTLKKMQLLNTTCAAPTEIENHFNDLVYTNLKNSDTLKVIETRLFELFNQIEILQNSLIKYICLELSKGKSVAMITEELPYSIRVIQKKFKQVVGLTMRQYQSNIRQRKIWEDFLKTSENKLDTILKHNYFDQSHFINDFKKRMNRTHTDFESYLRSMEIKI